MKDLIERLEVPACRNCDTEDWLAARKGGFEQGPSVPATHVAKAGNDLYWPCCEAHAELAMIAGWLPIVVVDSDAGKAALKAQQWPG